MADRVQILRDWIEQEGRRQNWVARQVGCSPQWLNHVLKGRKPLSDRLAQVLQQKLGVPLRVEAYPAGHPMTQSPRRNTQQGASR
jgi:hypothetical protein